MRIIGVENKRQMTDFVRLPNMLFANHPCYVPPLWFEEKKAYRKENNPILKNSDFQLFLALDDDGNPIGRAIAYVDHTFNAFYATNMGFFGAFDCIDDEQTGVALVHACEQWAAGRGMDLMRGPINPVAEYWGFVYKGYESPPVYMSPWNPPYYHRFFTENGYTKAKDLLVYEGDIQNGYAMPKRYFDMYDIFFQRYPNLRIRRLDVRHIRRDARAIWEISNIALKDNWGYVPLELGVMEDMLKKLKLIVDPDAVWIVEDDGNPVGFCLGFPDINVILKRIKGRLFPFGWASLLFGAKKLRDYRLFGLAVHPDWQPMALDAMMYVNLYRHLKGKNVRMEANYILEDNFRIKNALEKLGLSHTKTYRIYEKALHVKTGSKAL